ncbi:MAG: toxin ParE1/3/4 [Pseudomonadota bacterium]|nr:toxin ParE1/3/4 [Pseudomonadota bacterium]
MAVYLLPGAQGDLLALQEYMLATWSLADWLRAEDEIFDKLDTVDAGLLAGAPVPELAIAGITDYRQVLTSHHKLVYRMVDADVYVYAVAAQRQDFPALLMRRLLRL